MMKDERRRVHFVGVGAMGSAMVRHLATPDVSLAISDVDDERAAALAIECSATAVPAAELGVTAGRCDVMVLMLPDTEAVSSVLLGEAAVLERLPVGATVIDMGSSDPRATRSHAKAAGQRQIALLDAPVSGGVPRARTASLSIMVGGDPAAAEHVRDLLLRMGEDVQYLGPSGAGHAMKALNNLLSAIGLLGASEVLAIGREFGLDPHLMLDVLNKSTGGNHATRVKMAQYALSGSFDSNFSLALMLKDLRTAVDVAGAVGVEANLGRRCLEEWQAAHESLGPDADHTHIWKFVETERSSPAVPATQTDASSGTPTDSSNRRSHHGQPG